MWCQSVWSFEPSQAECRKRLAAKLLRQPSENRTPFELGGMSKKRCDSKQKAHRRKRRWACVEREPSVQKTVRTFSRLRRRVGRRCGSAGDGGVRLESLSSSLVGRIWNWLSEWGVRFADSIYAFPQHKTMLSRKATRVAATPHDQVVGLGDDDEFFLFRHHGLRCVHQQQADVPTAKMTGGDF
jgi:hypothetical protein